MRAVVRVEVSSARRVEVQSSLARQTWVMEVRERLEARRWGRSVSRVEEEAMSAVVGSGLGWGGREGGGCRDEVEEAIGGGITRLVEGLMCLVAGRQYYLSVIVTCRRLRFY